jgi:flagellar biosynthesis/type III secretory pathway M-ring protein FliF/YscJ
MPALPLDEAGEYVAGAYVVFLALLLIYVAIMAVRLQRINSQLGELAELAENRSPEGEDVRASDEVADGNAEPAAPTAPKPAGSGREAEHSGGGVVRRG